MSIYTLRERERLSRTMVGAGDLIITEYLNDDSLRLSCLYTLCGTAPFDSAFSLDYSGQPFNMHPPGVYIHFTV